MAGRLDFLRARLLHLVLFAILPAVGLIAYTALEQRQRAEALYQSEKLSAMGSFLGQSTMLAMKLSDSPHADRAGRISRAAERCARLAATSSRWPGGGRPIAAPSN